MRRVACIALPQIRIEIARAELEIAKACASPLAVIVARPDGTVRTVRDVLGNTRLDVVSKEARTLGVRVGQTVAAARAKCAELNVRVVAEGMVRTGLARVAEVALAFGPSASFDVVHDVVWIEIGGCAHLHGGERELARTLDERVRASGHACRVAIADGPRIASAAARLTHSSYSQFPIVVPAGKGASTIRGLPIEALDLERETLVWLRDLGLRTCGDLQNLPKRSLGTRLGSRAKDVMLLLDGEDGAPLDAWRPPEVPEERVELEWGASSVEALGFVVRALCDRLSARLEGRAVAAARIGLVLALDRGLLDEGSPTLLPIDLMLPVPIVLSANLFAVIRARLEHLELPAPVLAVTLRALELSTARPRPLDLLSPEPRATRTLAPLVAELAAELGPTSVGILALVDTWSPEERTRLAPFAVLSGLGVPAAAGTGASVGMSASKGNTGKASVIEPSRLVHPLRKRLESYETTTPLVRFEAVEWWRRGLQRRDFYAGWDGSSLAWLELRATNASMMATPAASPDGSEASQGEVWLRGWID